MYAWNLQVACILTLYTYIYIYTYLSVYRERENASDLSLPCIYRCMYVCIERERMHATCRFQSSSDDRFAKCMPANVAITIRSH